jgi:ammonia channel protein AmtB
VQPREGDCLSAARRADLTAPSTLVGRSPARSTLTLVFGMVVGLVCIALGMVYLTMAFAPGVVTSVSCTP